MQPERPGGVRASNGFPCSLSRCTGARPTATANSTRKERRTIPGPNPNPPAWAALSEAIKALRRAATFVPCDKCKHLMLAWSNYLERLAEQYDPTP